MRRQLLNLSASRVFGCRARGAFLRLIGFPLPKDGKVSCHTYIGGFNIKFGQDFATNERCWIDNNVAFGDNVRLGHGVKLITATHNIGPLNKRRGEADVSRPIVVENGVWLCADACVQPGVRLAKGCVIATGAIVVKDTEPNGFYAGNPAKRIADIADDGRLVIITTEPHDEFDRQPSEMEPEVGRMKLRLVSDSERRSHEGRMPPAIDKATEWLGDRRESGRLDRRMEKSRRR